MIKLIMGALLLVLIFFASLKTELINKVRSGNPLYARVTGDLELGALFPIHTYGKVTGQCGSIQDEGGIQLLEAMFFTLDKINYNKKMLPGIVLGVSAADSCDSDTLALERSVKFVDSVRDSAALESDFICRDGSTPTRGSSKRAFEKIVGVVGASSSVVSIQLANFLRLFHIPQISYLSTSPELSDTEKYPYFLRTVPSDEHQAAAIVAILRYMEWTYVSVVYDDTPYGTEGYEQLKRLKKGDICFAAEVKIAKYGRSNNSDVIETLKKTNANVVILYVDVSQVEAIFKAANQLSLKERFVWIGTDAWAGQHSISSQLKLVGKHTLGVVPQIKQLKGFKEYFRSLKPCNNTRNPWFDEYWENKFSCSLSGSLNKFQKVCSRKENLSKDFQPSSNAFYVSNSVLAYAYALKEIHKNECGHTKAVCATMQVSPKFREKLLYNMKKIKFNDLTSDQGVFSFHGGVNGPPLYSVMYFNNKDEWTQIGTFDGTNGRLDFNSNFKEDAQKIYTKSICSEECAQTQAKIKRNNCCWECESCADYQKLSNQKCEDCPAGSWPSQNRLACLPIPARFITHDDPSAIGMCLLCTVGILCALVVGLVYFLYRDTPVIKASSTELSFVLLIGIVISYAATYVIVAKPSITTCGLTRYFLGLGSTVCYSAILIKTNRLWRIFSKGMSGNTQIKYTSPPWMLFFSGVLILVEIILVTIWTAVRPPGVKNIYPTSDTNILVCGDSMNVSYLTSLLFPLFLMIMCIYYAIKTRRTPDGFNEARFIGFCTYATSIMWLAFIPIFFSSDNFKLRVMTLSLSMFMTASVSIFCLFFTKVYLVLFKPERNTREKVMANSRANSMPVQGIDSILDNLSSYSKLAALTGSTVSLGAIDKKRISGASSALCPRIRITSVSDSDVSATCRKKILNKSYLRDSTGVASVCSDSSMGDYDLQEEEDWHSQIGDSGIARVSANMNANVGSNNDDGTPQMDFLTVEKGIATHKLKPTLSIRL